VLFRRAIQLSVSSGHWAEVTYGLQEKAWGTDLPGSPVMLNPQSSGAPEPIAVFIPVGRWSDDPLLRFCKSISLEAVHSSFSFR
jgi:hypothetical protein